MADALTKKEKGFVKDYVKTGNGTLAVRNNYHVANDNVAATIAHSNIRKAKIQKAIKSIADSIPDSLLVEKHLALLNAEIITRTFRKGLEIDVVEELDNTAIAKGLDMAYKLKSSYAPEKTQNTTVHINLTPQIMEIAGKFEEELKKTL